MRGWCSWPRGSGLVHNPNPDRPKWTHRASLLDPVSFSQRLLEKSLCSSQPSPRPGSYWHRGQSPPHAQGSFWKRCAQDAFWLSLVQPSPKDSAHGPAPARTRRICSLASSSAGSSSSLADCTGRLAGLRPFPRPGHPACGHCQHSAYGCLPWEALPLSPSSLEDTLLHPWTAPRGTRQRPVHPRAPAPSGFRSCRNATVLPSQNSESGWGLPP